MILDSPLLDKAFRLIGPIAGWMLVVWFFVVLGIIGMAVTGVVYHMFDPDCPTVVCFDG